MPEIQKNTKKIPFCLERIIEIKKKKNGITWTFTCPRVVFTGFHDGGAKTERLTELDGDIFFSLLFSFVRSKRAESDVLGTCSDLTFLLSHHATSHLF